MMSLSDRANRILEHLDSQLDLSKVEKKIRGRVKSQMEKSQKEYYLNEQMKALKKELGEILKRSVECDIPKSVIDELSFVVRGNARNAIMKAKDINLYAEAEGANTFNINHYRKFCDTLGVLPYGITCTEKQILEILQEHGQCTLSYLAAKTGLSSASLRGDHESYLLRQNLMEIDGKRQITVLGRKIVKNLINFI
mgnify:CR=1 FL=1